MAKERWTQGRIRGRAIEILKESQEGLTVSNIHYRMQSCGYENLRYCLRILVERGIVQARMVSGNLKYSHNPACDASMVVSKLWRNHQPTFVEPRWHLKAA